MVLDLFGVKEQRAELSKNIVLGLWVTKMQDFLRGVPKTLLQKGTGKSLQLSFQYQHGINNIFVLAINIFLRYNLQLTTCDLKYLWSLLRLSDGKWF